MSRPTLRTERRDRAGVEFPVILARRGPAAGTGDPVAADGGCSRAGGLACGAVEARCGTAFLVSQEANRPDLPEQRILEAAEILGSGLGRRVQAAV